jgi:molybdopterin-biosynthesis enzyme MoeA-like protein
MSNSLPKIHIIIIGDEILSGRREDKHFAFVRELLAERNLTPTSVTYTGDAARALTEVFKYSFSRTNSITFSFGGIGATPDDKTRQAVASALAIPLERNLQAVAEIEAQFGEGAYPIRVQMADIPQGSTLIPNPINRVAGFSIQHHHFMPGFPQMSWPMMRWVLDTHYPQVRGHLQTVKAIIIEQESESLWVTWMEQFERNFPELKLYSLPHLGEDGSRHIELGCLGEPSLVEAGVSAMISEANHRKTQWKPKE